jgi:hypothetical protein
MTTEQHLLVCLAEECSEIQKEVMKILRFGIIKKGDKPHVTLKGKEVPPNHESLKREIIDMFAVLDMLEENGTLDFEKVTMGEGDKMLETKKLKVAAYMEYAHELGQLEQK